MKHKKYKEINKGKLPEQLRFSSGGNSEIIELSIHASNKLNSELSKSNKTFLDYITSDYVLEILEKIKIKIHLNSENIYCHNTKLEKRIFDFLLARQNETKNTYCKDIYSYFYSKIDYALQRFLQMTHVKNIEAMKMITKKDLAQNYNCIDLENDQKSENIMRAFAYCYSDGGDAYNQ